MVASSPEEAKKLAIKEWEEDPCPFDWTWDADWVEVTDISET